MYSDNFTFNKLLYKIAEKEPFSFSRFGDGEWYAIFQQEGHNCDGHDYFPDMGEALARVLKHNPPYHVGMQGMAMRLVGDEIRRFLEENNITIPFCKADILHDESKERGLDVLFKALQSRRVVLIGPEHLYQMGRFFSFVRLIETPKKNAWLEHATIWKQIMRDAGRFPETVYLYAAGMMTEVLIDELQGVGENQTHIDIGSLFDPYCGIQSRTYHKNMKQWTNHA